MTNLSIATKNFTVRVPGGVILTDISVSFEPCKITCIVGPSGSGKSTLIRSLNRINDENGSFSASGEIFFNGQPLSAGYPDVSLLRQDVGMVFQKPCVFPRSIRENVLFGVRKKQRLSKEAASKIVERSLKAATLWSEVSERLNEPATTLSLGQQQRLCIARTLAMTPKVLLLDESTASIDPLSGREIEKMLLKLKPDYTIVVVTHDLRQMLRIADHIVFIDNGALVEQGDVDYMLRQSQHPRTRVYFADLIDPEGEQSEQAAARESAS